MVLWPRTQLRIGWRDLVAGAAYCVAPPDPKRTAERLEAYWDGRETLVGYSVRSAFDLLIQALNLEPGDEVIYSALNVKAMIAVARRAGLTPVPLDLDAETMAPSVEALKNAITPRSKVLVIAHLFGARLALDDLLAVAGNVGLIVVEDCAQAFNGRHYGGHPDADLSLFSFGPLKTSTAMGGALIRVRDPELAGRMRGIQRRYPVQKTTEQANRILKCAALKIITSPMVFGLVQSTFKLSGRDYENAVADGVRNVAKLKGNKKLRFQPSSSLQALLCRRVFMFREKQLEARVATGRRLKALLDDAVFLPAQGNAHHDYWVFPVVVGAPAAFVQKLRARGFDAANLPRSQAVAAPADRPELEPVVAQQLLSELVILPCYPGMPDRELERLATTIRRIEGQAETPESPEARTCPEWHEMQTTERSQQHNPLMTFKQVRRRLVKRYGKKMIRGLRDYLASQSLVSNAPVLSPDDFPDLKAFAERWNDIAAELNGILEHKEAVPAFEEVSSDQRKIAKAKQWRTFILFGFGVKLEKNCAQAPVTAALLGQIPNLQTAWFSILEPGYHIPAHRGVTKGILRCHLGLIIPEKAEDCWIRIDKQRCSWKPGDLLVFDDTYEHEVRNDTDEQRVVLLFDFDRPMKFWGRIVNRAFICLMKLTAYYNEPKRKLRAFEEQFEAVTRRADAMIENLGK